jgi:hypothetical protein
MGLFKPRAVLILREAGICEMYFSLCSGAANKKASSRLGNLVRRIISPRRQSPLIHAQEKYYVIFQAFGGMQSNKVEMVG